MLSKREKGNMDSNKREIYKIPHNWVYTRLGNNEIFEIIMGQSPSSLTYNKRGKGIPFLQGNMEFGEIYPSPTVFCSKPIKIAEKKDILISVRAPVGEINISNSKLCIGRGLSAIRCQPNKLNYLFLFYYLKHNAKKLKNISSGSTFKAIRKNDIDRFPIPHPPLPEQQKIAEVLGTVDEAIEKVDRAIEKTERLKKGLMQELFTKGIGHKEFKDTKIGKIPREWEVVKLGDEKITEIRTNKKIDKFERIAFIPMELVSDSNIYAEFEIRSMKEVKSFTFCERGDLLLAKITPSLENGKQGIVPEDIPNNFALATTEVFPVVCRGIDKFFLFYILKFSKYRNRIVASMTGTTGRQRASKVSVEKLKIPLPHFAEQQEIVEILSTVDGKIQLERKKKNKLQRIKKGLMQDLLTGKKRVNV
jgi:type I restriction enzyme S subunit